jgi:hypothetical protein
MSDFVPGLSVMLFALERCLPLPPELCGLVLGQVGVGVIFGPLHMLAAAGRRVAEVLEEVPGGPVIFLEAVISDPPQLLNHFEPIDHVVEFIDTRERLIVWNGRQPLRFVAAPRAADVARVFPLGTRSGSMELRAHNHVSFCEALLRTRMAFLPPPLLNQPQLSVCEIVFSSSTYSSVATCMVGKARTIVEPHDAICYRFCVPICAFYVSKIDDAKGRPTARSVVGGRNSFTPGRNPEPRYERLE